jgi:hypothetical protein
MEQTNRRSVLGAILGVLTAPLAYLGIHRAGRPAVPPLGVLTLKSATWTPEQLEEFRLALRKTWEEPINLGSRPLPDGMEAGALYWTHNWTNYPQPWRIVAFSPELFLHARTGFQVSLRGPETGCEVASAMPEDLIVVNRQTRGWHNGSFECVVESQSFDLVPPGERIPWGSGPTLSTRWPSHDVLREHLTAARGALREANRDTFVYDFADGSRLASAGRYDDLLAAIDAVLDA